jgi:uncharacterized protein (TIGR02217 family)
MAFHNKRLDVEISYGSLGGPGFKTSVATAGTGKEQRNQEWERARAKYDLKYGIRDTNDMHNVIKFFYARRGRAFSWRFKDWLDYQIENQNIGVCQNNYVSGEVFQLFKRYDDGSGHPYDRVITKPVEGTLVNLRQDDVIIDPDDYDVDWTTGEITINREYAQGTVISLDYVEFDVAVRFDIDELDISMDAFDQNSISSIPIIEVYAEEEQD